MDRFAARGGRIDEGRLIALDERVRMVERSQTPQAQRDAARRRGEATAGRGHVSEVTDTSSASEIELQTPRTRRKRRARKAAGRGSAPRVRSSSDEEAQFRGAMSRAVHQADVSTDVAGGDTPPAPQPEPQPEPAQTQRSPQARSPSQEIATQTEPAQTARRIVSARKLTPREVDARARAIAEQAREEIRAAEEAHDLNKLNDKYKLERALQMDLLETKLGHQTKKELVEFIEQLNTKQFQDVQKFFDTMPRLKHTIKVKNPKTKKTSDVTLSGLNDFFA